MKDNNKLLLLIAAIVMLQLFAVYTLALRLQSELAAQFTNSAQVTLDDLAEGVTDRTKRFLRPVHSAVQIGVELMDKGVLDGYNNASLETYFETQLAATPWMSGLFLGRPDGSFVYLARNQFGLRTKFITITDTDRTVELVQRDPGGAIKERWIDAEDDYDPRKRAWYLKARTSDSIVWTEPYLFFSSGLPGISAAARTREGMTLGVDVELQELSAFIEHIPHTESGAALIIDSASKVIARSGSGKLNPDIPTDGIPAFADVAEAPMQALYEAIGTVRLNDDALVELDVENQSFLGLTRSFPIAEDAESWTLLVQMGADDYAGGALNFFKREIILLGVISLGLGVLALSGVLWLRRVSGKIGAEASYDPTSGALYQDGFERLLSQRLSGGQSSRGKFHGAMVLEARGLRRLADRLGNGCRDAVVAEIGRRLDLALEDKDLMGISSNGRYLVAVQAGSKAELLERFESLHQSVASADAILTPSGPQEMIIASGAAVLESEEPVGNLLPRAREALTLGIEREHTGCQIAIGLDAHRLHLPDRAA